MTNELKLFISKLCLKPRHFYSKKYYIDSLPFRLISNTHKINKTNTKIATFKILNSPNSVSNIHTNRQTDKNHHSCRFAKSCEKI